MEDVVPVSAGRSRQTLAVQNFTNKPLTVFDHRKATIIPVAG